MSEEINRILDSYINQEKRLLGQLSQIKIQRDDIKTEIAKDLVSLGASELFGRTGRKLTRMAIDRKVKTRIKGMEDNVDAQHRTIMYNITAFLRTISEWQKNIKEPNSHRLLPRIEKAQGGARIATRVQATIKGLISLKAKRLIYNKDIPPVSQKGAVFPPGSPFSASMELRHLLGSATGYVKICDTYVSVKTLDILNSIPAGIPIKLLTEKTGGKKRAPAFLRACKDFKAEHPGLEVRKGEGLHDRFILMKDRGWSFGSSLKDFGSKFSAFTGLQEKEKREAEKIFDDLWKKARQIVA